MTGEMDRIPPQNLEAESNLIGAVLLDAEALEATITIVQPDDFYAHIHATIWTAIMAIYRRSQPVDPITVAEELSRRGKLKDVGGVAYLGSLSQTIQTPATAAWCAQIVKEKARLRALIAFGRASTEAGFTGEDDVADTFTQVAERFARLLDETSPAAGRTIAQALTAYEARLTQGIATWYTPWPRLDKLTGGHTADDLTILASDPGFGKSMLAVMLAAYWGTRYGPIAFFATEMGEEKTTARFLALYSGISARRQRQANDPRREHSYSRNEHDKLKQARVDLEDLPISIFDEALGTDDVVAQCRRMNRRQPLKGIFIDTIGALADVSDFDTARTDTHRRKSRAAWRLKRLSKEIGCPVVAVDHFSRPKGSGNDNARPSKSRLRDGGNLEGTASTIIFPHRETGEDTTDGGKTKKVKRYMLIVDKARDGDEGTVPMKFEGNRALWLEPDQDDFWGAAPVIQETLMEEAVI